MKSKQSGFSLPKFVYHLGHLSRERIDITALSLGGSIARGTAKIVFWGLIAFLFFFLASIAFKTLFTLQMFKKFGLAYHFFKYFSTSFAFYFYLI